MSKKRMGFFRDLAQRKNHDEDKIFLSLFKSSEISFFYELGLETTSSTRGYLHYHTKQKQCSSQDGQVHAADVLTSPHHGL